MQLPETNVYNKGNKGLLYILWIDELLGVNLEMISILRNPLGYSLFAICIAASLITHCLRTFSLFSSCVSFNKFLISNLSKKTID
tara:strand:- start:575 stop:829 length:255 start_codon:yes stop_codon:yes gene_type:complete